METNNTGGFLTTLQRISRVIVEELGIPEDEIKSSTQFRSLVGDSLEMISLVLALEEEFNIDATENIFTISDAVKWADDPRS